MSAVKNTVMIGSVLSRSMPMPSVPRTTGVLETSLYVEDIPRARDFYQRVLLLEPGYARAYAGMADCWCRLADDWVAPDDAYPRAKTAATGTARRSRSSAWRARCATTRRRTSTSRSAAAAPA